MDALEAVYRAERLAEQTGVAHCVVCVDGELAVVVEGGEGIVLERCLP